MSASPQKQTSITTAAMSALCQKRTSPVVVSMSPKFDISPGCDGPTRGRMHLELIHLAHRAPPEQLSSPATLVRSLRPQ